MLLLIEVPIIIFMDCMSKKSWLILYSDSLYKKLALLYGHTVSPIYPGFSYLPGDPEVTANLSANHATFPKRIRKITVQICGNFWVTQYNYRGREVCW